MLLSIVIVNWNSRQLIDNCVSSIFKYYSVEVSERTIEVIVVDNGSTDGSIERLNIYEGKIILIENSVNVGYAPACNLGMRSAQGKYILLLGSDTVLKNRALDNCIKFLDENPGCGAAGCRLLNENGTIQNSCKRFPGLKNAFFTYLSLHSLNRDYDMHWFDYKHTAEVDQAATSFLMCRKVVLMKAGYFDEQYRILYNDVDLCRKIRMLGFSIFFLHTSEVEHRGSHSTRRAGFRLRKIMYGDIYRYYRNNFGFRAIFLLPILAVRFLIVVNIRG